MREYQYKFSVIIPCKQEYDNLVKLIPYLSRHLKPGLCEIIISNSDEDSASRALCEKYNTPSIPVTFSVSPESGRSCQLHHGSTIARGEILYFLHADVIPPENVCEIISQALHDGYQMGCFAMKFRSESTLLRFNSYFSHFNGVFVGGGDQSLFISQEDYNEQSGYDTECHFMEDFEFYHRARKSLKTLLIQEPVSVSARKYEKNGYFKVQIVNLITFIGFRLGMDKDRLSRYYARQLS